MSQSPSLPPRKHSGTGTGARKRPTFEGGSKLRILIAEDNPDSGESLKLLLEQIGYEAHLVADGNAAVDAAGRLRPDVVIMDIGLPLLDGYEATRRIRSRNTSPSLRIIALTGWGKLEDLRMAAEAGIDHHFLKPLNLGKLRSLLESFKATRRKKPSKPAGQAGGQTDLEHASRG